MWLAGEQVIDGGRQCVGVAEAVLIERRSVGSASLPVARTSSVCSRWA
jgi:hypothetical protein